MMASTLRCTNCCTARPAVAASSPSSNVIRRTGVPSMPPLALISASAAASAVRMELPSSAPMPLLGSTAPTTSAPSSMRSVVVGADCTAEVVVAAVPSLLHAASAATAAMPHSR
jgi:hypothetical protein